MHLLVLGGTGRSGRLVIKAALDNGHTVTALVRPSAFLDPVAGLQIVRGDAISENDLLAALASSSASPQTTAVIVALASTAPKFLASVNSALLRAMEAHDVRKLVVMSAFGVGDSLPQLNALMRMAVWATPLGAHFADHANVETQSRTAAARGVVKFVSVRPAMLKGEVAKQVQDLGDQGQQAAFWPSVSRPSVAKFLVECAESDYQDGRTPVVCD